MHNLCANFIKSLFFADIALCANLKIFLILITFRKVVEFSKLVCFLCARKSDFFKCDLSINLERSFSHSNLNLGNQWFNILECF